MQPAQSSKFPFVVVVIVVVTVDVVAEVSVVVVVAVIVSVAVVVDDVVSLPWLRSVSVHAA